MYNLPDLPYATDALLPYIDEKTMTIHHTKHHQTYITNLNAALADTGLDSLPIDTLVTQIEKAPKEKQVAIRNNGGGHYNHTLFWQCLSPKSDQLPSDALHKALTADFGSYEQFKSQFETAAKTRFGSGWAWLYWHDNKLQITSTPNQDNPLMTHPDACILLGLDVWEHAYYLHYQNRRPDYIAAFWHCVNWAFVSSRFENK